MSDTNLQSGQVIQTAQSGAANIFDRAVLLNLEFGKLGIRRRVDASEVQVDSDKSMLFVSKEILSSDSLKAIGRHDADTRSFVKGRSIPSKFRAGTFLVSLELVESLDSYLVDRAARRADLVRSFLWEYQRLCDEARIRLAALYVARDYPRISKVEGSFTMSWSYAEMSAPGRLESISSEIYRRAKEQATKQWESAITEGKDMLRAEFQGMVNHLADVLVPNADGTPKRIKAPEGKRSWLSDIQDFLTNFRARDLGGDDELGAVVDTLRGILGGVPIVAIKSDDAIREQLSAAVAIAQTALAGMVISGGRNIDMSDDEDEAIPALPVVCPEGWNLV